MSRLEDDSTPEQHETHAREMSNRERVHEARIALLEAQQKRREAAYVRLDALAELDPRRAAKKAEKLARRTTCQPHTFVCRACAQRFSRARNAVGPDVWRCDHCNHDNTPPRAEGKIIPPPLAAWMHEQHALMPKIDDQRALTLFGRIGAELKE